MSDNDFEGLDFQPDIDNKKKKTKKPQRHTVSVSLGLEARVFINSLLRHDSSINISRYIENLLLMASLHKNLVGNEYYLQGKKYRECRLLLRSELADFIEAWVNYGIVGNSSINNNHIESSTPLQIARKISFLLANDPEFRQCDSNIYGYKEVDIEKPFERLKEKSKQLPKDDE